MPYPYYQNYPNYNQLYLQQPQQNVQQTPQIQNGGFIIVKNITEAMNYPVAPGNSVTFKIESQPYICTKTLGFSQLDQPIFEVFKLVKEEKEWQNNKVNENTIDEEPSVEYLSISQGDEIKSEMNKLKDELMELKSELNELKVELGDIDKTEVVSA
jgi:hypothetical protein